MGYADRVRSGERARNVEGERAEPHEREGRLPPEQGAKGLPLHELHAEGPESRQLDQIVGTHDARVGDPAGQRQLAPQPRHALSVELRIRAELEGDQGVGSQIARRYHHALGALTQHGRHLVALPEDGARLGGGCGRRRSFERERLGGVVAVVSSHGSRDRGRDGIHAGGVIPRSARLGHPGAC